MNIKRIEVDENIAKRVTVVCATDEYYATPTMTMIKSMEKNTNAMVNVIVLDGGMNEKTKRRFINNFLNTSINLILYEIDNKIFPSLKTSERMPIVTYYRLLIPEILYQFDKIIYLDGDIIVLGDIEELFNIDIEDFAIAAVQEMNKKALYVSFMWGINACRELKIPLKSPYFNAGVLIMNLKKWRDNNLAEKIFNYLVEYEKYVYCHDQDGLNAVLWNDWKKMPPIWNVMTAIYEAADWSQSVFDQNEYEYIKNNVKLVHYINCNMWKPWLDKSTHPLKGEYWHYNRLLEY